jgi:hypothetical protein
VKVAATGAVPGDEVFRERLRQVSSELPLPVLAEGFVRLPMQVEFLDELFQELRKLSKRNRLLIQNTELNSMADPPSQVDVKGVQENDSGTALSSLGLRRIPQGDGCLEPSENWCRG